MYQVEQSREASVSKDETFQASAKIFKLISSVRSRVRKSGILQIWTSWSLQGQLRAQFPAASTLQRRSSHLLPQTSNIFNISKSLCFSVRSAVTGKEDPKLLDIDADTHTTRMPRTVISIGKQAELGASQSIDRQFSRQLFTYLLNIGKTLGTGLYACDRTVHHSIPTAAP